MQTYEVSLKIDEGGRTNAVSVSSTSAQSAVITTQFVYFISDVAVFVRQGASPTALSDGTDMQLPANTPLRLEVKAGNKLAFKTASASGTVRLTPGV